MRPSRYLEHICTDGDRWDTLAWHYYGDPYAYAPLIAANPALDIAGVLASGQIACIPVVSASAVAAQLAAEELPPWKRA